MFELPRDYYQDDAAPEDGKYASPFIDLTHNLNNFIATMRHAVAFDKEYKDTILNEINKVIQERTL